MIIGIQDEILWLCNEGLLGNLLVDKTTHSNILWATNAYKELGPNYHQDREIFPDLITGKNSTVIKNRARKELEQQSARTRHHAEVFTPLWMCDKMNNFADKVWFGKSNTFKFGEENPEKIIFNDEKQWQKYVDSRRLEITCGEAPYLVSRYDVSSGEIIKTEKRIGILDRKLRVVNENVKTEKEWIKWATRAVQSTYGYEFQGDNLLIARVNVLMTFGEYMSERWNRKPTQREYKKIANIIAWNIWQMDGLSCAVPYCKSEDEYPQMTMFDKLESFDLETERTPPQCKIFHWRTRYSSKYSTLNKRKSHNMKFDFIIGNPPYQGETIGDNKSFAPPVYHKFIENSYKVADCVELIHPARFLFNAGSTPKSWNREMLENEHLKVLYHIQDSRKVFPNTDIKGGVAITYFNAKRNFGPIKVFTHFNELNGIMKKVSESKGFKSLSPSIYAPESYRFTPKIHSDNPWVDSRLSAGHSYDISTNIFDKIPELLYDEIPSDKGDYIGLVGLSGKNRATKWIKKEYVKEHENLYYWKVFIPKSNGSGALGEVLSTPLIGHPLIGHTQTFISIGKFETEEEATALLKYIKSKFARTMLGILKVTQDNKRSVWKYVPLQDFTSSSDIDWAKSISDIDKQLYSKYNLSESEIEFIESHVKEME